MGGAANDEEDSSKLMHFQLRCITSDFEFLGETITVSDPRKRMTFSLRKRELEDAERPAIEKTDGLATVTCERPVAERLYAEAASRGVVSLKKGAVGQVWADASSFMLRTLRLIRWRANSEGRHHPIRMALHDGFRWSLDGRDWRTVTDWLRASLSMRVHPSWTGDADEFLTAEVSGCMDEPIGHVLLREAWTNRSDNLRSAIVLAVAAAEVGFKQFACSALPDAAWVLENAPSPPLVKMLTEFFPWSKLSVRIGGQHLQPPPSVIATLSKAVKIRNDIVHGRANDLTRRTVASVIIAVRDLLYFLDVAQGHEWALWHFSAEARKDFPQIALWPLQVTPMLPTD